MYPQGVDPGQLPTAHVADVVLAAVHRLAVQLPAVKRGEAARALVAGQIFQRTAVVAGRCAAGKEV
jgi:hypothetical protein